MKYEFRIIQTELRVKKGQGEIPTISGHAALFNSLSLDLGGWRERIAPGAFRDSLAVDDIRALFNHDSNQVLGRNSAGTLVLREDELGLYFDVNPPETDYARNLVSLIERGDVSQNSFGFQVLPNGDRWDDEAEIGLVRTLVRVKLWDVSPVTFPAYPQTDLALRSLEDVFQAGCQEIARRQAWRFDLLRRLREWKLKNG